MKNNKFSQSVNSLSSDFFLVLTLFFFIGEILWSKRILL